MDTETTFDLMSSSVRRTIIAVLHESNSVPRDRLTAILARVEADGGDSENARRSVRIALHHTHLPRLEDNDLITYDDETVTATAELETVAQSVPLPDVTGQTATSA